MKLVIGISGKAQHGKDTIATYLQSRLGGSIVHFTDLLKEQAQYLGWDGTKDIGGRTFLQTLSEPIRKYGNWLAEKYPEYRDFSGGNYYSASLYNAILEGESDIYYIADMRMMQEYKFFLDKGNEGKIKFITLRVDRLEEGAPFDNGLTPSQKLDKTETELDTTQMDYHIINDGDISALETNLEGIVKDLCEL